MHTPILVKTKLAASQNGPIAALAQERQADAPGPQEVYAGSAASALPLHPNAATTVAPECQKSVSVKAEPGVAAVAPPRILDLRWREESGEEEPEEPVSETPAKPTKPKRKPKPSLPPEEQDALDARRLWMEIAVARQKHLADLWQIIREGQVYVFESVQQSYLRQLKAQQKASQAWMKVVLGD